ncbi:MAG: alpha/beta hydrolase family esterase [Candidatus Binatia bacterium]
MQPNDAMRLVAIALLIAVRAGADLTPGDTLNLTLAHDGETRLYDVHVPASYDGSTAVPLILDFHGLSSNKTQQAAISGFRALSETAGFIVVWPQGLFGAVGNPEAPSGTIGVDPFDSLGPAWNAAGWCCGAARVAGADDVGFARALVEAIDQQASIDRRRVYVTGLSNGGGMTQALACAAADVFAAAAPVALPLPHTPLTTCQPSRPIAVMHFAGLTDIVVPYAGGPLPLEPSITVAAAADSFARWHDLNGCLGATPDEVVTAGDSRCETYTSCAAGVRSALCSIEADAFPGGFSGHITYFNPDIAVAQTAWNFLSQFTLPEAAAGVPVAGTKLLIKNAVPDAPAKARLVFVAKDAGLAAPAPGSPGDPRAAGGQISVSGASSFTQLLPASGWRLLGTEANPRGYKYTDATLAAGPCALVLIKDGALAKAVCKGGGATPLSYDLQPARSETAVTVSLALGAGGHCATFGGASIVRDGSDGKTLLARGATAPASCP